MKSELIQIKQTLKIKTFLGTSENAVLWFAADGQAPAPHHALHVFDMTAGALVASGAARLVRNTVTHCTGPLDLVTNPSRHNGSIFFECALITPMKGNAN